MKKVFFISILMIFISCQKDFKDYKCINNDIYFKLISFKDKSEKYVKGNYVGASIILKQNHKVIFYKDELHPILPQNKMIEILRLLSVGDSAVFMIKPDLIKQSLGVKFKFTEDKFVEMDIKLDKIYSPKQYEKYIKDTDFELIEQSILQKYLTKHKQYQYLNGIYVKKLKKTGGDTIKNGNSLKLKYAGSFLNGIVFDQLLQNQYFYWKVGTPNQLIKGLEIAIKNMKKGEKSKIIIPSQLAFGALGSSTEIVPPYTTVIYNIEIIN